MRTAVLDGPSLAAFLFGQPGDEAVVSLLERAAASTKNVLITASAWAEIRLKVEQVFGRDRWLVVADRLGGLPIEVVSIDRDLAELAAQLACQHNVPLNRCFTAAVAKAKKADLYTQDESFDRLKEAIKLVWI